MDVAENARTYEQAIGEARIEVQCTLVGTESGVIV